MLRLHLFGCWVRAWVMLLRRQAPSSHLEAAVHCGPDGL